MDGKAYRLAVREREVWFRGDGFDVRFEADDPAGTISGDADVPVDLGHFHIMECLRRAVLAADGVGWLG